MFTNAIVRRPGRSLVNGITSANLGIPDYKKAYAQHEAYIEALKECDVNVTILEPLEAFPDSVFVEDTAILTEKCAILTNPGAQTRKGEEHSIYEALQQFYSTIELIAAPGTIEGGDVMRVGDHFYVGLSSRTNNEGFSQFQNILKKYGYTASPVFMKDFLHLKTGVSYLENNKLLVAGEFVDNSVFESFNRIFIPETFIYSANSIWVNNRVLIPQGYSLTVENVQKEGYKTIEVDVSEFRKLDGGLSCLSLRF